MYCKTENVNTARSPIAIANVCLFKCNFKNRMPQSII